MTEWIKNTKFDVPVPYGTMIDVQYRDGEIEENIPAGDSLEADRDSSYCFWQMDDKDNDIVAWRLHKEEIVNIDKGGWIGNEGKCPVHKDTIVYVMLKGYPKEDGDCLGCRAGRWCWGLSGEDGDVLAWRPYKEEKQADKHPQQIAAEGGPQSWGIDAAFDEDEQEGSPMPAHLFTPRADKIAEENFYMDAVLKREALVAPKTNYQPQESTNKRSIEARCSEAFSIMSGKSVTEVDVVAILNCIKIIKELEM